MDWNFESDSGSLDHLTEVLVAERVSKTYAHAGSMKNQPAGTLQASETPTALQEWGEADRNVFSARFMRARIDDDGAGEMHVDQIGVFRCTRCGMLDTQLAAIPKSGYTAEVKFGHEIDGNGNPVISIDKIGSYVAVDGYAADEGPSVGLQGHSPIFEPIE